MSRRHLGTRRESGTSLRRRLRPLMRGVVLTHDKWGPGTLLKLVETRRTHPKDPWCYLWQAQVYNAQGELQELWEANLGLLRRIVIGYHPHLARYFGSGKLYAANSGYGRYYATWPDTFYGEWLLAAKVFAGLQQLPKGSHGPVGDLIRVLDEHGVAFDPVVVDQVDQFLNEEINDEE